MNNTFRDCNSKVNTTGLLGDLGNIANYLKYNYFWDCDSIANVTLRLWKFSDFCSRHIVDVAGDGIMFHILVFNASDVNLKEMGKLDQCQTIKFKA